MKLIANAKSNLIFLAFLAFLSVEILGQGNSCGICGDGTKTVIKTFQSGASQIICLGKKPTKSVKSPNKLSFIAEFATQLLNRNVTVKELKKNQDLLNGLLTGHIKTDEETIDFTPVEIIRETIIQENPEIFDLESPENKFLLRRDLDGFNDAWEKYIKEIGGQVSTPIQINFLTRIGEEYLQSKTFDSALKAIKVFKVIAKNLTSSSASIDAQLNLGEATVLSGKIKEAIKIYQKIENLENVTEAQKDLATEKIQDLQRSTDN